MRSALRRRKKSVLEQFGALFPTGSKLTDRYALAPRNQKTRFCRGPSLTVRSWDVSSPSPHRGNAGGSSEEDVSTTPKEPETHARFPQAHEHPSGPRGDQASPPQGAQEAHGQRSQEIGRGDRPRPARRAGPWQSTAQAFGLPSGAARWTARFRPNPGCVRNVSGGWKERACSPPRHYG
jgi:hypothetical protein